MKKQFRIANAPGTSFPRKVVDGEVWEGIIKLQRPVSTNAENAVAMAYDETRELTLFFYEDTVRELFATNDVYPYSHKQFFAVEVHPKPAAMFVVKRVAWQDW